MRPIDADALLEELKKTDRYFMVKADIDNAPTVDAYSEGYTDSILLFADEIMKFFKTHEQTFHTDFSRGYQTALIDLGVYFKYRGIITDENINQDTV